MAEPDPAEPIHPETAPRTRALLEAQRNALRRHLEDWPGLPRMTVSDLYHLITQMNILIGHLDPGIPVELLERGSIE